MIINKSVPSITECLWKGQECICFSAGGYKALIVPSVGANVVELKNIYKNTSILRTPDNELEFTSFKSRPQVYGIPLLFPPNRIEDGKFKVGEKEYQFPINELARNNYIHGFIKNEEWKISKKEIVSEDEVQIEATFNFTKEHEFYKYFSHEFQCKLCYSLSSEGLKQTTKIINLSKEKMPVGIGFHTAFNIPFNIDSNDVNCKLIASIKERWPQDKRNLSTGDRVDLNEEEKEYLTNGIDLMKKPIESQYRLDNIKLDGGDFRGAIITDKNSNLKVVYEIGEKYKYITIWNDNGDKKYACIEPQSWLVNAPNVNLDDNITGFKTINPMEAWSEDTRIYIDDIK